MEITRAVEKEKSFSTVQEALEQFTQEMGRRNFYEALRFPESSSNLMLAKVINKAARAQTERSMALCAIALQRYFARNGKFPTALGILVPEFFQIVPIDYFDGKPMKYFLNPDGSFTLYSVGEDGLNDHGNSSFASGKIGRSIWDRKDTLWPAPATPEELDDFHKTTLEK